MHTQLHLAGLGAMARMWVEPQATGFSSGLGFLELTPLPPHAKDTSRIVFFWDLQRYCCTLWDECVSKQTLRNPRVEPLESVHICSVHASSCRWKIYSTTSGCSDFFSVRIGVESVLLGFRVQGVQGVIKVLVEGSGLRAQGAR